MAQHDYVIDNQTFPATRTDINNALSAIVSTNAGASAPSTTYAYQLWYDTTNDILKMRNSDDDAWIDLFDVNQTTDVASVSNPSVGTASNPVDAYLSSLNGGQLGGSRNLIINGNMAVSQRGTSETGVTTGRYANAPDRFKVEMSSAGTWTVSQSTTAPDGFSNSYKFDCTTADASLSAGDYLQLSHYLEGQDLQHLKKGTSDAEKVTLSFHVRSNKTGTYIVEFYDSDNSRSISKSYTISSADTWEKKTITIDGDTSGTFGNDTGGSLGIFFYLGAGSNFTSGTLNTSWGSRTLANSAVGQVNLADSTSNDWYLTGVQLEVGTEATPFEHRSVGDELLRCQRYFYKKSSLQGSVLNAYTTAKAFVDFPLPVPMRAAPTQNTMQADRFALAGVSNITSDLTSEVAYGDEFNQTMRFGNADSDFTAGLSYIIFPNSTDTGATFDAEL